MRARLPVVLALTLVAGLDAPALAESRLSPADARFLDSLMKDFLFDPTGAKRVRVQIPGGCPYSAGHWKLSPCEGWLVKDRVVFTDGYSIPAPPAHRIERIDFLAQAEKFFDVRPPADVDVIQWIRDQARKTFRDDDSFLALAAWYHRLGHERFAAEAMDVARALSEDPRGDLRKHLRYEPFFETVFAFAAWDDRRAVELGSHYLRLYAGDEPERTAEIREIVQDAKRRLRAEGLGQGRLRHGRVDDARWAPARRVAALIDALEHTHFANTSGFGGPPPFDRCPTIAALIAVGEPAVPALIDALERDDRLTRVRVANINLDSFPQKYHYLGVRQAVDFALRAILELDEFPPAPGETEDDLFPAKSVARVRHYWRTFGPLPFDERMMRHLTDERTPPVVCRRAAVNLAQLDHRPGQSHWCWIDEGDALELPDRPSRPRPAVSRFTGPTAAEAVLAAADRDWAGQNTDGPNVYTEQIYLTSLVALGDDRIGPELGRRAAASQHPDLRRRYAFAALRLGAPAEWTRFARDVERGRVVLERAGPRPLDIPAAEAQGRELTNVVAALIRAKTPDSDRALAALTASTHPYYPLVRTAVGDRRDTVWTTDPFCLAVLRNELHDDQPSGGLYQIQKGEFVRGPADAGFYAMHYEEWADLRRFHTEAEERVCDAAGLRLSELVIGMPFFHPLCKDADDRITHLIRFLDTYRGRVRVATEQERDALRIREERAFIPDLKPLGRPATAADVKAGLAVFHQDGKGRVWTGPVPQRVTLKPAAKQKRGPVGLVVQAEADADGKAVYGVIFRNELRKVRADEVE